MALSHNETENGPPTPRDEDWEAEFDPTYDEKTSEGGEWDGKTDDEIVLIQIDEYNWDEHEKYHQVLDEREGEDE
jgi:hypothetical protein